MPLRRSPLGQCVVPWVGLGGVMKIILPLRAEFGMKCWWHAPAVHAIGGEKLVYIEPGEEALYPSASKYQIVERQHNDLRRNRYSRDREFINRVQQEALAEHGVDGVEYVMPSDQDPRERFVPKPFKKQDLAFDVVICPRRRLYGAEKNWPEWINLTNWLVGSGLSVFAAGAPDSSYKVPCWKAWEYDRFLDASIEAILSAKLVIATDAGLAHLAVLCGRPLLLLTHGDGLVAPGPIVDETGRHFEDQYFRVKTERYEEANHTGSEITILRDAWYDPNMVFNEIMGRVT